MVNLPVMISGFLFSVEKLFVIFLSFLMVQTGIASDESYDFAKNLIAKKKWSEAIVLLRNQINENPNDIETLKILSGALVQIGRREEALSLLNQNHRIAKTLRPRILVISKTFLTQETLQNYQEGMNLLQVRKYKKAEESFGQSLEKEKDNVEILMRLGQVSLMLGNVDSSAEYLKLAIKLSPYEDEAALWLARVLHQRGETQEADQLFKRITTDYKSDEIVLSWISELNYSLGKKEEAFTTLSLRLKKEAKSLYALRTMAKLRLVSSDLDRQELSLLKNQLKWSLTQIDSYYNTFTSPAHFKMHPLGPSEMKEELETFLGRTESRLREM